MQKKANFYGQNLENFTKKLDLKREKLSKRNQLARKQIVLYK